MNGQEGIGRISFSDPCNTQLCYQGKVMLAGTKCTILSAFMYKIFNHTQEIQYIDVIAFA